MKPQATIALLQNLFFNESNSHQGLGFKFRQSSG